MKQSVAPYAGAWIEISIQVLSRLHSLVAPYAGAWIEIMAIMATGKSARVAPYAGAWIEMIEYSVEDKALIGSLPTRERGLKYWRAAERLQDRESLPTRERGLKSD